MTTASDALMKASIEPSQETLQAEKQLDEIHERVLEKLTSLSDGVTFGNRHLSSSGKLLVCLDCYSEGY